MEIIRFNRFPDGNQFNSLVLVTSKKRREASSINFEKTDQLNRVWLVDLQKSEIQIKSGLNRKMAVVVCNFVLKDDIIQQSKVNGASIAIVEFSWNTCGENFIGVVIPRYQSYQKSYKHSS